MLPKCGRVVPNCASKIASQNEVCGFTVWIGPSTKLKFDLGIDLTPVQYIPQQKTEEREAHWPMYLKCIQSVSELYPRLAFLINERHEAM